MLQQIRIDPSLYDLSSLYNEVKGYLITTQSAVIDNIRTLALSYIFDIYESEGQLRAKAFTDNKIIDIIPYDDLIVDMSNKDTGLTILNISSKQEAELPRMVTVTYIDKENNYEPGTQFAIKQITRTEDEIDISIPVVLNYTDAFKIANNILINAWSTRQIFNFSLPFKYIYLDPSDIIEIVKDNVRYAVKIVSMMVGMDGVIKIDAVSENVAMYEETKQIEEDIQRPKLIVQETSLTNTYIIDTNIIPQFYNNVAEGTAICAMNGPSSWRGGVLYESPDGGVSRGNTWNQLLGTTAAASTGELISPLKVGNTFIQDKENACDIILEHGTLFSATYQNILNGVNLCIIGNELIQFQDAIMLGNDPTLWRISNLMRGRFGTEHEAVNQKEPRTRFILLDSQCNSIGMSFANFSATRKYKTVSYGSSLANTDEFDYKYTGNVLRPWSVVRVKHIKQTNGDWHFSWTRRTRLNGDLMDFIEIPLNEDRELYDILIYNTNNALKRTITSSVNSSIYTKEQQIQDFGSEINELIIEIFQVSNMIGRGYKRVVNIS